MRALVVPAVLAASLLAVSLSAAPAHAVNYAGLKSIASGPDGLTFQRARVGMPGLQRVIFDKADLNHDGVIDAREWPTLQSLYNVLYVLK